MTPKKLIAGAITGVLSLGAVDASILNEKPLERLERVANERVEAKQLGNIVETTLPWKGEAGIKVKYDLGEPGALERIKDKRDKEILTEVVDINDGGFKVDILLNKKPDTNIFCYTIEGAENYNFFYQPPLTAEEIADGSYRAPEIEGSYAVYHKTLKNHIMGRENYATGKVMHIPRPQVWELNDKDNTTVWADLSYNDGQLCVTVDQEYLNKAKYPVRVDPTFGYTSVGGSGTAGVANRAYVTRFTSPSDVGTVQKLTIRIGSSNAGNLKGIIVDSSKNLVTNGVSVATSSPVNTWTDWTFSTPPTLTASTVYGLGFVWESTAQTVYDAGTTGQTHADLANSFTTPQDLGATTDVDRVYSVYATYTTGASDSCTYTSGDWNVKYSDNCHITSDVNVSGACNFNYDGAGSFSLSATINCGGGVNGGAGFKIDGTTGSAIINVGS